MIRLLALCSAAFMAGCMQAPEETCTGAECPAPQQVAPQRPQMRGEMGLPPQELGMLSAALPPYPVFVAPPPAPAQPAAAPRS